MCLRGRGFFAPNDPHRGGAVCSARQVKRGGTAVPDIDGSVTNTEGLISKQLFHRLYNTSTPIASKTHEHNHARGRKPPTHAGAHRRPRERHRAANLRSNLCL